MGGQGLGAQGLGSVRKCGADSQHIGYKFRRTWHNLSHNLNKYHAIMRDICDKITKYHRIQENMRLARPETAMKNKQNDARAWPNVWSFCLAIYFIGYCILNRKKNQTENTPRNTHTAAVCYVRLAICLFLMEIIFAFNNINSRPPPKSRKWDAQSVSHPPSRTSRSS